MWMVDPAIMCRQHLLGEHRELHALLGVVTKTMSWNLDGYVRNNLIEMESLAPRHEAIAAEMVARGYNHQSPFPEVVPPVVRGVVDRERSLAVLLDRCPDCRSRNEGEPMKITDLREGQLIQDRNRTLYKVSTIYPRSITAQVLLESGEVPPRTAVRTLLAARITQLRPASAQLVHEMEDAWGLEPRNRGEEIILNAGPA
jgi:hypothetical protein